MARMMKEMVFHDCPIRNVLSRICDKWSLLVIYTLNAHNAEPIRFNALRKLIPDISQKMLTSTLKTLEADGYVNRKVYAEVPPRVEYSLTPRSETLIPIMNSLIEWAGDNMAMILKDRQQKAVQGKDVIISDIRVIWLLNKSSNFAPSNNTTTLIHI